MLVGPAQVVTVEAVAEGLRPRGVDEDGAQGAVALYALGGLYDDVPHTRPVRLSSTCDGAALRARLKALGVTFSDYEGPASLHSALLAECRTRLAALDGGHDEGGP